MCILLYNGSRRSRRYRPKEASPKPTAGSHFSPSTPPRKKKKSQEKDRQTEEERHLTHISLQDNHTKTFQLSHRPWGPKVIYWVVAPEMQIIPGLHSLLFYLTSPSKKNHKFSPCLSNPCARDPGREGPGPDSPAWDYSEKVVFKWKACLSKLTLANLPLHIQPLLALASQVKHSGSATQTLTGLCCTTLLFSLTLLGAGEIIQHTWEWRSHSPSNFNYLSWLAEALKFG